MIYVLLAEGFEEIEALTPVDVLRRAGLDVKTVGITGKIVTGTHGIAVTADILPHEMTSPTEMLVLPGGMPGAANLNTWEGMNALLEKTVREGGRIGAICAAPMILGSRGYLKDRYAVCFPGFEKTLAGAKTDTKARVITDGPFTTAIGMGAALEFACELVSCLLGIDKAAELYTATLGK